MSGPDDTTTYLKGLAILTIVAAHFGQYFFSGFYLVHLQGYASGVVSIFFLLAGYLSYGSLRRRMGKGVRRRGALAFLLSRAWRIYPLYWLALLLTPLYLPEYQRFHQLDWSTSALYLAIPLKSLGVFWFVPAIVQCYLAAPLLFLALNKIGTRKFLAINLAIALAALPATLAFLHGSDLLEANPNSLTGLDSMLLSSLFVYRRYLLANIILFALGLALAPLLARHHQRLQPQGVAAFTALTSFLLFLHLGSQQWTFTSAAVYLMPPLMMTAFALCLLALAVRPALPGARLMRLPGEHSYSIYLLHMAFFGALGLSGLVKNNSLSGGLVASVLTPAFFLFCGQLEKRLIRWRS